MALKVLLVEDDRDLRTTLKDALDLEGYDVIASASVADASAVLRHATTGEGALDLVILDLGLPDGDGGDLLRAIRQQHAIPVLIISARQQDAEKVGLLDAGADDYVVKPFSISELLARMRVTLRHRGTTVTPAKVFYQFADVTVDLARRDVVKAGQAVHLTPTEFKLLARLIRQAGQIVTHRQLLLDVWGAEFVDHTHYLRLYMGQLRSKLESNQTEPVWLLTEPGVGYRVAEPTTSEPDQ